MKLRVLAENTACRDGIGAEHGLSLWLETGGHTILFDIGQSSLFEENARKLGLDLTGVEAAIVSHGHYDHGGGLKTFLERNKTAPVYLSQYALEAHYHGRERFIGLDGAWKNDSRLIFTQGDEMLFPGVRLCVPGEGFSGNPRREDHMLVRRGTVFVPDDFRHEQYLLIEEPGQSILISGCSHRGIGHIIRKYRPQTVIGGFHTSSLDPNGPELEHLSGELADLGAQYYTCHCTGLPQYVFLKERMGERIHYLSSGMVLEL